MPVPLPRPAAPVARALVLASRLALAPLAGCGAARSEAGAPLATAVAPAPDTAAADAPFAPAVVRLVGARDAAERTARLAFEDAGLPTRPEWQRVGLVVTEFAPAARDAWSRRRFRVAARPVADGEGRTAVVLQAFESEALLVAPNARQPLGRAEPTGVASHGWRPLRRADDDAAREALGRYRAVVDALAARAGRVASASTDR